MKSNAECWRRRLAVLVIATSWLTGCVTAGFEAGGLAACLPVVEYSREFQMQAAEELALLPDRSVVVEMMGDYAVMREQAQVCAGKLETSLGKHMDLDDAAFQFLLDAALNRVGDMRSTAMVIGQGKTATRSGAFASNHAAASGCPAITAAK